MIETTRLHITPLTPDILPSVLPASIRSLATEISFHEIATFPENNYGYVTLPTMEADKIKKKLNGSILKGKKFKVEPARPQKRHREEEVAPEASSTKKKSKKSKKHEPEDGVVEGFELPADRKVKRGWTESSDAKQERRKKEKKDKKDKEEKLQPKSKYTDKSECLFRATVPPNRASDAAADDKKAKKKKSSKEAVVHEFAKTVTQPSFLRIAEETGPLTATFEEGKGWVNADGTLRETANDKIKRDNYRPGQVPGTKEKRRAVKELAQADKKMCSRKEKTPEESSESEDYTSSSGSSTDDSSDSESEAEPSSEDADESTKGEPAKPQSINEEKEKSPEAAGSDVEMLEKSDSEDVTSEAVKEMEQDSTPKEVHPLEALFKRAPPAAEAQPDPEAGAGFSFFGNDIESENESQPAEPQTPFTPFTKHDLQDRVQRSAAPTPDTTAATKHMKWEENDSDDSSIDSPVKPRTDPGATKDETEFTKWFWENRGDNNRAWKKRRRDAAKEQRQRDNRKKGFKGKS
ncbi:hypothetical protein PENANT_c049G07259 [Penicillium antarcticum]|uniref:Suppressor protein SRP40 n=1 Tax=Penicillium antarcticum TaxID=416450 RepID=A0A1V6PRI2_9EURO|nr:uncharacterized protein N7508_003723 [Penicillium antarcticum]KAJ5312893.1 hypothetical protein N7508_003723 [Penicillium antarcticum]OQD79543.1 hypothetical protein PENANT_c049G07259 [Penicillium antarcticum]